MTEKPCNEKKESERKVKINNKEQEITTKRVRQKRKTTQIVASMELGDTR